jgi:O-antigen/teichoic acid export membrane protein
VRPPGGRNWHGFGWGFLDQGIASATTLALTVVGGRAVGAGGLGVVVIGWTAYLLVLLLQRALVTRPLVALSMAAEPGAQRRTDGQGLTATLGLGCAATLAFVLLGFGLPGAVGRGLLLFAPWVAVALIQEYWRTLLFREGRGGAAVVTEAAWLAVLCGLALPASALGTEAAVAAAWGLGAAAASLLGLMLVRVGPAPLSSAVAWWREAWPFSRWLGLESVYYAIGSAAVAIVLNGVIGPAAVGGLRAAQSLFAPLSLLTPALALPGLPAMGRALARSPAAAFTLARRLSLAVVALTAVYVAFMVAVGPVLMPFVFGDSFERYTDLAVPIGVWQVIGAAGAGFTLLLTAWRHGRELFVARVLESTAIVALVVVLATRFGLHGAAWAYAGGAALGTGALVAFGFRARRRSLRRGGRATEAEVDVIERAPRRSAVRSLR